MNENIIKKDLLRRKITEYFSKNPQAKSVIIKANMGSSKTIWRVVKEQNNSFNITEVNTQKDNFLLEYEPRKEKDSEKTNAKASSKGNLSNPLGPTGTQIRQTDKAGKPQASTPSSAGDFVRQQAMQGGMDTFKAEPATMTRQQSAGQAQKSSKWLPSNPNGEFVKTLSKTKNLGSTLSTAYQDMVKDLGGEQQAVRAMNSYLGPTGATIAGQNDLNNPAIHKKVGTYLASQFPNIRKTIPNLPTEGVVNEASVEFSNISRSFTTAMAPPFDHIKLSKALKDANTMLVKIKDDNERTQVGAMIGALTSMVDATTAGGGSKITAQPSGRLTASFSRNGKIIREDDEKEKDKKKKKSDKKKDGPDGPGEIETSLDAPGPGNDADEVAPQPQPGEPDDSQPPPEKKKTEDQAAVTRTLQGQTIKGAELELTPNGGAIILDLVSAAVPARLEWNKNGKVVYHFKGVPYILRRE